MKRPTHNLLGLHPVGGGAAGARSESCTSVPPTSTPGYYTHNLTVCTKSSSFATMAELSASIVHQMNQPLTSMLANAQAAKRWLSAGSPNLMEAIASVDRIARDARTAGETIKGIRALFKRKSPDKKEASVPYMVNEATRLVLQDPEKCGIPIECHFDKHLPEVYVDPVAIQEVLINLTSNAMEAMEHTKSPLVEVRAAVTEKNEMLVQVIDNGPGVGDTEEIFNPFVTTKKNGMGIGLAVSRSIAEAHGGRLWVENNPSGGATFCLALPMISKNHKKHPRLPRWRTSSWPSHPIRPPFKRT